MVPAGVYSVLTDLKWDNTRLGAFDHSHPNMPPIPSRTDLAEVKVPGVLSLIMGYSPVVEVRAWRRVYDSHGVAVRFDGNSMVCSDATARARIECLKRAVHDREMARDPAKGSR
jgi:hypothetical protein